uniref:Uncharacterized protein LOC114345469 n=1 Tax=Diabrotica virgifera virgifera TaxID=50390 RepID=A0A6P7GQB1_DIAVI
MGIEVKINEARKLGDKIYLVELDSKYEKMKIMKNTYKLKELPNRIYINDDLTKREREIQSKIRATAKEEKIKGKIAKVGYQKLILDNEVWKWNREREKLEKVNYNRSKN